MGSRHRISVEHNLCLLEVWGSVSDRQMLEFATRIWDDPDWYPGMHQLNDFRRLDEMLVELEDMKAFVERERERMAGYDGPDARVAVVVKSDIHEAGISLYGMLTREIGHVTRSFPAMRPAVEWLGIDPRTIWPGYDREPRT